MAQPLVSVVTVCRNAAQAVPVTLRSVLEQQFSDLEYIVIDGASTDGTAALCRAAAAELEARGVRACVVSEPDGGIYDAMNKGVARATGEWVCFMNAGDAFYAPDSLARLFAEAAPLPAEVEVLYGNVCLKKHFGSLVVKPKPIESLEKAMAFCHQAALTRRTALLDAPFRTEFRIVADYDFFFRLYRRRGVAAFRYSDVTVAVFEAEEGTSSHSPLRRMRERARIQGVDGKLSWRLWYVGMAFGVGLKAVLHWLLPRRLVLSLRRRNYERLRRRRLAASETGAGA